ncbi:Fc.00g094550.m01.CDS01 [Cosmosporella sp. VM-42]
MSHTDQNLAAEKSLVAQLCKEATKILGTVANYFIEGRKVCDGTEEISKSLSESYNRLALWSYKYGVADGKLDDKLVKSKELRHDALETFMSIGQSLIEGLASGVIEIKPEFRDFEDNVQRMKPLIRKAVDELGDFESGDDSSEKEPSSIKEIIWYLEMDTKKLEKIKP